VQQIAAWLAARPLNGLLVLSVASALPGTGMIASIVLVMLVLANGMPMALLQVAGASLVVVLASAIGGSSIDVVLAVLVANWMPTLLLAAILLATRSLTLMVQLSVIIVAAGTAVFVLVTGDPVLFWEETLARVADMLEEMGRAEQANALLTDVALFASQLTMLTALAIWTVQVVGATLGYLLYRQLPGETVDCGRFRDLNLGRVLALIMALASVSALLISADWLQSVAFVLFACFWLQGIALMHWLHGAGYVPLVIVIAVYVLLPLLNIVLLLSLAALGYADAWFRLRRYRAAD